MRNSIFSNRKTAPFWAFFCAAGWSLAYPLIKLGYAQLHIASDDLGSKIGFAGIRFLVAGILVTILAIIQKRKFKVEQKSVVAWLLLFALVNTALHYLFSYVGLGYLPSSRSTILDSMNGFFAIILSCIIFEDDKFSKFKALGCILGFGGILLINIEPGQNFFQGISFRGDGMILLNALCGAFGGIITRIISKKNGYDCSNRVKHDHRRRFTVYYFSHNRSCIKMDNKYKINYNNGWSDSYISSMFWSL